MATPKPAPANADEPTIETDTLMGDIRTALLDALRNMPKPWQQMGPDEQQQLIDGCTKVSTHLVSEAVRIVASNRFPAISGRLIKAQIKDGMQLQVDVSRFDAQRLTIIDSVTKPVFLVIAEPDMFMGERTPAKPDASGGDNVTPIKDR